jgi:hypothetical protein
MSQVFENEVVTGNEYLLSVIRADDHQSITDGSAIMETHTKSAIFKFGCWWLLFEIIRDRVLN